MISIIKKLYRKIFSEKKRVKIRNIQYLLQHLIFKTRSFFLKLSQKNQNLLKNVKKEDSIFYIIPTTKITGGVVVCLEHLNRLKKAGFKTLIVSYDNKTDLSWFPNQKVKIIPIKRSKDILKNYNIGVATGWITAYELFFLNVPRKIYFVQSDERRFYPENSFLRKRVEETYRMPFEFMTEAKWIKNWLKKEFGKNAIYIPNGVNTNLFYPDKPLVPKEKNKIRVLVEGPANLAFKGVEESLLILNKVKKMLKNTIEIWYVNNDGKPKKNWQFDKYFENIPINYMRNIYSSCDFLLKLSKVEGFPGPPLEMIACGGIPIVLKTNGIEEYLKNNINGIVLNKIDEKTLLKIFKNKKLKQKIKHYNMKNKLDKFSWDKSINKLITFLKNEK